MNILGFFKRRRNARLVAKLAGEISDRSYAAVMQRVKRRATAMRIAEARGYVRARALEIAHREMAALHRGKAALDTALQTAIIGQATETLVVRVLAEVRNVPKAASRPVQRQAA